MKMYIRREQIVTPPKKGLLGGSQEKLEFKLHLQLELTDEENDLAKKYSKSLPPIMVLSYRNPEHPPNTFDPNDPQGPIYKWQLEKGIVITDTIIANMLKYEAEARKGLEEGLKNILEVAKNYGGEEVIEY